jgi:hypothetical protein
MLLQPSWSPNRVNLARYRDLTPAYDSVTILQFG